MAYYCRGKAALGLSVGGCDHDVGDLPARDGHLTCLGAGSGESHLLADTCGQPLAWFGFGTEPLGHTLLRRMRLDLQRELIAPEGMPKKPLRAVGLLKMGLWFIACLRADQFSVIAQLTLNGQNYNVT